MGAGPSRRVTVDRHGHTFISDDLRAREGLDGGDTGAITAEERREIDQARNYIDQAFTELEVLLKRNHQAGVRVGYQAASSERMDEETLQQQLFDLTRELELSREQSEKALVTSFEATAAELEASAPAKTPALVCEGLQTLVTNCYKADPSKSLECSDLVKDYLACAATARQALFEDA